MIRAIQSLAQGLLLRIEKIFNGLFGAESNPLYQLGAITYFLFWIILGSGFYLYIFYRTGVRQAYDSVEAITRGQWYAGGIMRSLHRYASDAMVLTVLIHMAKNFAMNRLSGFRAFSWITGIVALLTLYISGINGYWLVWDRLAQFVAVASTEWLDWLPIFSTPSVRNFLLQESVNDRFFSLLSFAHLGIPLAMLALVVVHTQRVSGGRTHPSRRLAVGLALMLLGLALLKPAVSRGRADLGSIPSELGLDWFFLPSYPLIYLWSPGRLWGLVGGFLAMLLLLPVLGRTRGEQAHRISTSPSPHAFDARPGETILEAALRHGVRLPYSCRDGACGVCKGAILQGTVAYGIHQADALTDSEKRAGKALFCRAVPLCDLEIEFYEREALKQVPVRIMTCRVRAMRRLAPEVMALSLARPAGESLDFLAGQHLDVLLEDGARRSFSFANPPHDNELIELHIRRIAGGRFTTRVFTDMKVGDELRIEGPLGTFLEDDSDAPTIFLAGATGFAPVKSILEHRFHIGSRNRMLLYWGVRSRSDLYMADLPTAWQRDHPNFSFVPVLSAPLPEDRWEGRTGLVHEAVLADFPDLRGYLIYVCGSMQMVHTARPAFLARGLPEDMCISDAFLPAAPQARVLAAAATL